MKSRLKPQLISHASCFSGGADIWITTPLQDSFWTRKMDWYVNLQLLHLSQQPEPQNQKLDFIAQEMKLELPEIKKIATEPTLIPCSRQLPARFIYVTHCHSLKSWISDAIQASEKLKISQLRFFLNSRISQDEFITECTRIDANEENTITFVGDSGRG